MLTLVTIDDLATRGALGALPADRVTLLDEDVRAGMAAALERRGGTLSPDSVYDPGSPGRYPGPRPVRCG